MLFFKASNQFPLNFIQSGNLMSGDSFTHSKRCLKHFALLAGLEGNLYISQNDVEYTMGPGEFVLLFPGYSHYGYRTSEGMLSYYWAHFTVEHGYQLMDEDVAQQYLQNLENGGMKRDIYLLPEHGTYSNSNRIALEFRQLMDFSLQETYSTAITNYALSLLVMDMTQGYLQQNQQQNIINHSFSSMADLQDYIRHNFQNDISVSTLADIFGYNANYLSSVYKKLTGVSLVHFINQTRIAAAKTLLLDTADTIASIASRVGYSDSKYFIRVFRQVEGTTPLTYRNIYFRKHINHE